MLQPIHAVTTAYKRMLTFAQHEAIPRDTGGRVSAVVVQCFECDDQFRWTIKKSPPPPEAVKSAMANQGWEVTKKHALCPACVARRKAADEAERAMKQAEAEAARAVEAETAEPVEEPMAQPNNTPTLSPSETPPREPSRADTRRIFRNLDDCYDDANERYLEGWDDEVLASELKVPRKWVSDIREAHFGPPGNAKEEAALEGLEALIATLKNETDSLIARAEEAEKVIAACQAEIDTIKRKLGK